MTTYGDLLHAERKRRNLSVRKLADIISAGGIKTVSGQMLTVLEKKHKPPSWRLAWAIIEALDIQGEKRIRMFKAVYRARMQYWKKREGEALDNYMSQQ